ncbi:DUF5683 domain-containing protein [Sphingobacterium sp. Mn56C]|uniref:DUF5683 domain-containing protein n=1 Tax=Sphingobacterium sp. Mn56C TaxID=3395261 RepID=UPI003BCDEE32
MSKYLIVAVLVFAALRLAAQTTDSTKLTLETGKVRVDSISAKQDTVHKETRAERKLREKAEKEREKYYYKNILKDSTRLAIEHVSHVAWRRSMFAPGWGQITNGGKYLWIKLPVIYGGFITAYFVFDYWNWYYQKFLKEAQFRTDNPNDRSDPDLINYELPGIIRAKDSYRRYRDMTILVTALWWTGNVIEAYTDSMLRNRYNISDKLSFKVNPTFLPNVNANLAYQPNLKNALAPGVKLTFNF